MDPVSHIDAACGFVSLSCLIGIAIFGAVEMGKTAATLAVGMVLFAVVAILTFTA